MVANSIPTVPDAVPTRRNVRALVLTVSLVLIGGTGCITMSLVDQAQRNSNQRAYVRQQEQARQQRLDQLAPAAAAGDAQAMLRLAVDLLDQPQLPPADLQRALALLEKGAARGDGPARAMLGQFLLDGELRHGSGVVTRHPAGAQPERGRQLLRLAATQGCAFNAEKGTSPYYGLKPAEILAGDFRKHGDTAQAALWQARNVLHCGKLDGIDFYKAKSGYGTPDERQAMLALALLKNDADDIAAIGRGLPPEVAAAAATRAAELRRLVADSEQPYPAPPRPPSR